MSPRTNGLRKDDCDLSLFPVLSKHDSLEDKPLSLLLHHVSTKTLNTNGFQSLTKKDLLTIDLTLKTANFSCRGMRKVVTDL